MNICSYKKVNPMDERGVNDRFSLLFKEVCYLKANSGGTFLTPTGDGSQLTGLTYIEILMHRVKLRYSWI